MTHRALCVRILGWATALCLGAAAVAPPLAAQLGPPGTGGLVTIDQALRRLGPVRRVLMIGAHPDDEDTELLTILTRGIGAEAAYLSLNRGEGGQNLIGNELGEDLGLLRTEELMGARTVDGARQFFTRAYDFGFTKTLDETWRFWPRDSLLKDVVRVIRAFRPQVIVSVFSGTPRDGHGQHQAAGWLARRAFDAAADPALFPDAGAPWTPARLYRSTRFDTAATTLRLAGGRLDPALGSSFHQLAMEGRSLHRSQDMGQLQEIGPSTVRLALLEDRAPGGGGNDGIFDGIETRLDGNRAEADRYRARIDSARALVNPETLPALAAMLDRARQDLAALSDGPHPVAVADQLGHLDQAIFAARGLVVDALAPDAGLVAGQAVDITVSVWNTGDSAATVRMELQSRVADNPPAWSRGAAGCATIAAGTVRRESFHVVIPPTARPTSPSWLDQPRNGALYPTARAQFPRDPPLLEAHVTRCGAVPASAVREVVYRTRDQSRGEVRTPLRVVPRVEVALDPAVEIWSSTRPVTHTFTVTLTRRAPDPVRGTVGLELPAGWPAVEPRPFSLTEPGERESWAFQVTQPPGVSEADVTVRAWARDTAGRRYDLGIRTVDYPHIRSRAHAVPAAAEIHVAPIAFPRLSRVGYVRGAADRVPEALRSVGLPVEMLDREALERGDLSRYDAIIVGSRAYETDTALVENNPRLLGYVRAGGLLIVQYQQYPFFDGHYAPYPMTLASPHDRVTDETARVEVLPGGRRLLAAPNRIGDADWDGWVQERGLYFAHSWDDAYTPALELHDPGEPPLRGGLLVAPVGKGTWVYTGLSFFRELPAGVTGAMRLFANLLGLGSAPVP